MKKLVKTFLLSTFIFTALPSCADIAENKIIEFLAKKVTFSSTYKQIEYFHAAETYLEKKIEGFQIFDENHHLTEIDRDEEEMKEISESFIQYGQLIYEYGKRFRKPDEAHHYNVVTYKMHQWLKYLKNNKIQQSQVLRIRAAHLAYMLGLYNLGYKVPRLNENANRQKYLDYAWWYFKFSLKTSSSRAPKIWMAEMLLKNYKPRGMVDTTDEELKEIAHAFLMDAKFNARKPDRRGGMRHTTARRSSPSTAESTPTYTMNDYTVRSSLLKRKAYLLTQRSTLSIKSTPAAAQPRVAAPKRKRTLAISDDRSSGETYNFNEEEINYMFKLKADYEHEKQKLILIAHDFNDKFGTHITAKQAKNLLDRAYDGFDPKAKRSKIFWNLHKNRDLKAYVLLRKDEGAAPRIIAEEVRATTHFNAPMMTAASIISFLHKHKKKSA